MQHFTTPHPTGTWALRCPPMTATVTQHSIHPVLPCPLTLISRRELYTLHFQTYTSGTHTHVESSLIRRNPCLGYTWGFPYTVHILLFASDIPRRCYLSSTYPSSVYWQRDTHISRPFSFLTVFVAPILGLGSLVLWVAHFLQLLLAGGLITCIVIAWAYEKNILALEVGTAISLYSPIFQAAKQV